MSATAYIALGSNLGDRKQTLDRAVAELAQTPGVMVARVSSYHETAPVGGPEGQGQYLNAAAEVHTALTARELLLRLLEIETRLGRVRHEHHGPRTLDLDLLLYGLEIHASREPDLIVPHPRLHERSFVLEPLAEIAPLAVHPILRSTAADLLRQLREGLSLTGLHAVVTGSTSGIGRAIALEFARAGAALVIHGHRSVERAEEVAHACRGLGTTATVQRADLREETACEALVARAWQEAPIDVWVNNAGADILTGAGRRWSFERKLQELWLVDVRATMILGRATGRHMRERGHGVIVNIGWDQAATGMEGDSGELFAATKGAVMAFTRSLALSLAPAVRVNCLAPGWVRTAWGDNAPTAWQERVLRETPRGRWGTPDDIARAARWLAAPASGYITGQIINVNGGAVRT